MTIIYFDLISTFLFFSLIFYVERAGIVSQHSPNPTLQQLNSLVYRNAWLFVLPYFYSITFLTDLETYFLVKSKAIQIIYFFLLIIFQVIIFLRIQPQSVLSYGWSVKEKMQKIHQRFAKKSVNDATNEQDENLLVQKRAIVINIQEVDFLLNSFTFPLLFMLTNSFYLTKIISYFF